MAIGDDGLETWSRTPVGNFKKGLQRYSKYNDPTYLGFVLMFDWTTPLEHSYNGGSPLLAGGLDASGASGDPQAWETKPGTAMYYLKQCGEYKRMEYLNAFINTLKAINLKMPWYWQEIEGLENAWKNHDFKDPYKGGDEAIIKIKTLESIDLIVTKMMDLYKKAIYDDEHRRIIVPENLRKFQVNIYVKEIRKFQLDKLFLQKLGGDLPSLPSIPSIPGDKFNDPISNLNASAGDKSNKINNFFAQPGNEDFRFLNEAAASIWFAFEYCEWRPDESNLPFGTMSMSAPEMATQSIVFNYENLKKFADYPDLATDLQNQSGNIGADAGSGWKDALNAKGKQIAANAVNSAADFIKGKIAGLVLGNVYGFSIGDIASSLEQGTIQGISAEFGQAVSGLQKNKINSLSGDDNVYK